MPQRPDLAVDALVVDGRVLVIVIDEGIVIGHRAVVVQPQDLAHVGLHVLGRGELLPVA